MPSTRSVGMKLARPFKAGKRQQNGPRRGATVETPFNRRYATRNAMSDPWRDHPRGLRRSPVKTPG